MGESQIMTSILLSTIHLKRRDCRCHWLCPLYDSGLLHRLQNILTRLIWTLQHWYCIVFASRRLTFRSLSQENCVVSIDPASMFSRTDDYDNWTTTLRSPSRIWTCLRVMLTLSSWSRVASLVRVSRKNVVASHFVLPSASWSRVSLHSTTVVCIHPYWAPFTKGSCRENCILVIWHSSFLRERLSSFQSTGAALLICRTRQRNDSSLHLTRRVYILLRRWSRKKHWRQFLK